MPTFRISYSIKGRQERKEVIWTAEPSEATMSALAHWIMRVEFPKRLYLVNKDMEMVLRSHGITEIRSPVPIA